MARKSRKKAKSAKKVSYLRTQFNAKNPRTKRIFWALVLLFSLFLILSFFSHIFSYKSDYLFEEGQDVKNIMGTLGRWMAIRLMHNGFGLGAFSLVFYIFYSSMIYLKWIGQKKQLSISIGLLFLTFWLPLFLASITNNENDLLHGALGFYLFDLLKPILGRIGVILVLIALGYVILEWGVGISITLKRFRKKVSKEMSSEQAENEIIENQPSLSEEETPFQITEEHNFEEPKEEIDDKIDEKNTKEIEENVELIIETQKEEELTETKKTHYTIDTPFDPKLELSSFKFPPVDLLNTYGDKEKFNESSQDLGKSKDLIVDTLKNYKIEISTIKATIGPTVTLFEIVPAPGVKISKIKNLEDDIALSLAALGIRIIAPIPGKGTIGIEVPNKKPVIVSMSSLVRSKKYQDTNLQLPVLLGKTISNEVYLADLAKMPHLLMAGATGQGKSVGLNAIIVSLLYKRHPAEIKFVLVDPKKVELTLYNALERHYLAKLPGDDKEAIITDNQQVVTTLNSLCLEMDDRYKLLQSAYVRNIKEYNTKFIARKLVPIDEEKHRFLPYIVVVIDEVADLIMTAGKEVEHPIGRLAQLARAVGIHLILATQRPSVNIITGTIKANFPARLAFRVTSRIDSRTILDGNGADQLVGKGDCLFSNGNELVRLQCPFVDTPEVEKITEYIGAQRGYSEAYVLPEVPNEQGGDGGDFDLDEKDALFEDAARVIVNHQQGSTSLIQRKMKIGYNRAGRLIDQLEHANIVGPFEGSKARQVLVPTLEDLEQLLQELRK